MVYTCLYYHILSILWLFWWFLWIFWLTTLPICCSSFFFGAKLRVGFWPRLRVRKLPIISWNFACQWRCKAQMIFDVRWRQSKHRQKTTRGTRFKISCSGCGSKLELFEVKAAVPVENCWATGMVNRHRRKSTRTATNQSNRRRNCEVRLCLHLVRFYDSETLRISILRG